MSKIYSSLLSNSSRFGGRKLLQKVKKECNCTVDNILDSQSQNNIKSIRICDRIVYSHTSIYDFGISQEDIRIERLSEK